ncbi:MAG: hypothetical protein ACRDVN_06715 [Jiangellaceae bacterium]
MSSLPDPLVRGAHSRSSLRAAQVSVRELTGALWRRAYHGRYAWSATDEMSPEQRIAEAASVLPDGGALSGWAAAYSQGATDLDGRRWDGSVLPVLMALPYERRVRRRGIATIRAPLADADLVELDGVVMTSPVRSCFDEMRCSGLEDAVVAIDAVLRAEIADVDSLDEYVAEHRAWKGVPIARRAIPLADARARSCPESRFRVLWVVEAGIARPEVNVPVYNPAGLMLGIPDLLDVETGLVGEYDGADHRALRRHTDDNAREERLEAHGLTVVRATSIDLMYRRRQTIARLRDGFRRAVTRDRQMDRWTIEPPETPWPMEF